MGVHEEFEDRDRIGVKKDLRPGRRSQGQRHFWVEMGFREGRHKDSCGRTDFEE